MMEYKCGCVTCKPNGRGKGPKLDTALPKPLTPDEIDMLHEISQHRVKSIRGIMHRQPWYSAVPFPFVQIDYHTFGKLLAFYLVAYTANNGRDQDGNLCVQLTMRGEAVFSDNGHSRPMVQIEGKED